MNVNDPVGLSTFFKDDPTIIDTVPPFRWTGRDAVATWLSQSNAFASEDGVKTFTQSGSEMLEIAGDSAEFDAAFAVSLSKKGRVGCGKWAFILQRSGDTWKIQEAIWTSLDQADPEC